MLVNFPAVCSLITAKLPVQMSNFIPVSFVSSRIETEGSSRRNFFKLNDEAMREFLKTRGQLFQNAKDLIAQEVRVKRCPITSQEQKYLEHRLRNQNVVANFIPAFIATLRTALSFFHPGKVPTIVWECSLILGLYFQLLSLASSLR